MHMHTNSHTHPHHTHTHSHKEEEQNKKLVLCKQFGLSCNQYYDAHSDKDKIKPVVYVCDSYIYTFTPNRRSPTTQMNEVWDIKYAFCGLSKSCP